MPYLAHGDNTIEMERMIREGEEQNHELELLKAVAQVWHSHSQAGSPHEAESEAQKSSSSSFRRRPSRFKLEASKLVADADATTTTHWDFAQSLLDSYEIVTLSRKLEANLALDLDHHDDPQYSQARNHRKRSRNTLRNLLSTKKQIQ